MHISGYMIYVALIPGCSEYVIDTPPQSFRGKATSANINFDITRKRSADILEKSFDAKNNMIRFSLEMYDFHKCQFRIN